MASKLKLTELLHPDSAVAAITINADNSVTIPTQSTTNLAYTGTLTGGTGVVNIGSGQLVKDASGRVLVGSSTARANLFNATTTASLQVEGTTADNSTVLAIRNTDTAAAGSFCILARARGSTVGSTTIVQNGDAVGSLSFQSSDGSEFVEAARIQAIVNGTPGANDMPGALVFNTTADGAASSTERMRIDSSGNVGIGVTPAARLDVSNSSRLAIDVSNAYTRLNSQNPAGNANVDMYYNAVQHLWFNSGSELARITAAGNLLVGQTATGLQNSNSAALAPTAGNQFTLNKVTGSGSGNQYLVFGYAGASIGSITQNGTTGVSYNTSSDYRLKEITGAVTGTEAKDFIMALQPKQGTWKADGSKFVGFLAHEFQEVSPTSVSGEKDAVDKDGKPIYQGMQAASSEVMANLIALVQQQQALIQDLTTRLTTLEGN
jgi:hypothetical protein